MKVLKLIDEKVPYSEICKQFNIAKGTVSKIKSKRESIERHVVEENGNKKCKRSSFSVEGKELDRRIYEWFCKARGRNSPLTGKLIQEKALIAAQNLGMNDFKASNGWLESFQTHHQISSRIICGESAFMNTEVVENWKSSIPLIIEGYEARNIFNCDETGLFWKGLPDRTLATKKDKCKGGKLAKERLTVLLTVSAVGEKLQPLIIWRSLNPRCFNKRQPLGIQWYANKTAWMTGAIFSEYLVNLNDRMRLEDRKILLLLDNAAVHTHLELSHLKLVFFPPNTTAVTQPLDAGIIKNFKYHYRRLLVEELISRIDSSESTNMAIQKITVLQAIQWIKTSFLELLRPQTTSNCFAACGFPAEQTEDTLNYDVEWQNLVDFLSLEDPTFDEGDIATFEEETNDNWEEETLTPTLVVADNVESIEDTAEEEDVSMFTWKVHHNAWKAFYDTYQYHSTYEMDVHVHAINKFYNKIAKEKLKETKITAFFASNTSAI